MANSRVVIKGAVTNALTQVNGANKTNYLSGKTAYGTIAANTYTKGDYFYFKAQLPSSKLIRATFATRDTTPIVKTIYPGYNVATPVSITATAGTPIAVDWILEYDNNYSGKSGQPLILQVN